MTTAERKAHEILGDCTCLPDYKNRQLLDPQCKWCESCDEVMDLIEQCEHWRVKAQCYGDMVHGVSPALAAAGFPVEEYAKDGNVGAIARAVAKMRDALAALKAKYERLLAAAKDLFDCHAEGGYVQPDPDVLDTLEKAIQEAEEAKE
jgi:hypothetical protein